MHDLNGPPGPAPLNTGAPLLQTTTFAPVDRQTWRTKVERELRGASFEKTLFTPLLEGLTVAPLYGPEDVPNAATVAPPGQWPFVRGARARASQTAWHQGSSHTHPDPAVLNAWLLEDLAGGADAVCLRLDRAARLSLEADQAPALPHLGEDGTVLHLRSDLERVLRDLKLELVQLELEPGANALPLAALLLSLLEHRQVDPLPLSLHLGADPLGALAQDGQLNLSLAQAMSELSNLARACSVGLPCARAISVSTLPYHRAGAHGAQELACALSTGLEYLRALEKAGLPLEDAARQFTFKFAVGKDLFLEIAKLRAARVLWAKVLHASAALPAGEGLPMWIHAVSSPRTLTRFDPWANLLRVSTETFAAVVGGADVISSTPFDAALGQPEALGRRIARNTQRILQEESHLGQVVDPAGGSWYVEHLSDALAREAWKLFQDIEARGGMSKVLLDGSLRQQIDQTHAARQAGIHRRKDAITGLSEFALADEVPLERAQSQRLIDREARIRTLNAARAERDPERAPAAGQSDDSSAGLNEALGLAAAIGAAAEGATLAELAALRPPGQVCLETGAFPLRRDGADFETLRDASHQARAAGHGPRVYLANLGPLAEHTARATWSRNFFQAGGLEVLDDEGMPVDPDQDGAVQAAALAARARASGAQAVCVCGSDGRYAEVGEAVAAALKQAGFSQLWWAGKPGSLELPLRAAGVRHFIFMGCDVYEDLHTLLSALEVLS